MMKKRSFIIQISLILCFVPAILIAKTSQDSVLPEGARVVAGDLSQNEFFILAKGEKRPALSNKKVKRQAIVIPSKLLADNNSTK